MRVTRTTIATAVTLAGLGGLGAVALASGSGQHTTAETSPPATQAAAPVEVRTEIVRRTNHRRVRAHVRGEDADRHRSGPGEDHRSPAPATTAAPVTTHTSQVSGHGRDDEGEHELGDDHGGEHELGDDHGGHGDDDGGHEDDHGGHGDD